MTAKKEVKIIIEGVRLEEVYMKAFWRKGRVLEVLSLIFVLSLLLGVIAPFSAIELAEENTDENTEENTGGSDAPQSADVYEPYVVFGAEDLHSGIVKTAQGSVAYIKEAPSYVKFTPEYGDPIDPSVTFEPAEAYSADAYKYVSVVIRAQMEEVSSNFFLYYVAGRGGNFSGDDMSGRNYSRSNGWQVVTLDLSDKESWQGEIHKLRLDVCNTKHPGTFDIAAVIFSETPQAVYDGAFDALMGMFKPEQIVSDFNEGEESCFSAGSTNDMVLHNTKVTQRDGKIVLEGVDGLSDPYAGFMYQDLMEARGVDKDGRLTTEDFENAVIRFRAGNVGASSRMELFLFTGDNFVPFQVSDGETFASVKRTYTPTNNNGWQCISFNMRDGVCDEIWNGDFNGFRIDWCAQSDTGGYAEISDIAFFADNASADAVASALNTVTLPLSRSLPTDRPFLTPLKQDADMIVLTPDDVDLRMSGGESVVHVIKAENGEKSVIVKTVAKIDSPNVELDVRGVDLADHRYLSVLVKRGTATFENFVIYPGTEGGEYADSVYTAASYESLDGWQVLTFMLEDEAFENGDIVSLRLDFAGTRECNIGDGCEIGAMAFSSSGEMAYDAAYYLLSRVYVPVQILSDFTDEDVGFFNAGTTGVTTTVSAVDGSLVYSSTDAGKDPGKMFRYMKYAEAKGIAPVTTLDFRYTVIRYGSQGLSASNATMELFIMTGDAKNLFDMASIYDVDPSTGSIIKLECRHCARAQYLPETSQAWKAVCLDMAVGDGYDTSTHLKNGWYREDGNYTFGGFRMDWCLAADQNAMLRVSDIIFFQDESDAAAMSAALSAVSVPVASADLPDDDFPFDDELDTDSSESEDTLTESLPELNSTEQETVPEYIESDEETVPEYIESDEETVPEYIESDDETDSEDTEGETAGSDGANTEESLETDSESDSWTETERVDSDSEGEDSSSESETGLGGGYLDDEDENKESEGSQLPFYLACGAMVVLSIASIISVLIIRSREKIQKNNEQ